jgi:hypothetical protein
MVVEGDTAFAFSDKPAAEGVWADYSAQSTIVGWSSFTQKRILIKKIGKMVFVSFALEGVSNSTAVSFTLPYTIESGFAIYSPCYAVDNGILNLSPGMAVDAGISVNIYKTYAGGTWTNSGNKSVLGQFFYEAA